MGGFLVGRVWFLLAFGWIFGGLWLLTILTTRGMPETDASGNAPVEVSTQESDERLELDSVIEVESINAGSFQPWTNSHL